MKKCLVVALSCLVSFAAHADMFVDITVERAGHTPETRSLAMNEVALFQDEHAGVSARLVAVEQDGIVSITADCTRVQENGETICNELPSFVIPLNELVTLVKTEEMTVTIVARNTDAKAVAMEEELTCQEDGPSEIVTEETEAETTKTAQEDMIVELLVTEVVTETTA